MKRSAEVYDNSANSDCSFSPCSGFTISIQPIMPSQPVAKMRMLVTILCVKPRLSGIVQDRSNLSNRPPWYTHPIIHHNARHGLLLTAALHASLGVVEFKTFVLHDMTHSSQHVADRWSHFSRRGPCQIVRISSVLPVRVSPPWPTSGDRASRRSDLRSPDLYMLLAATRVGRSRRSKWCHQISTSVADIRYTDSARIVATAGE